MKFIWPLFGIVTVLISITTALFGPHDSFYATMCLVGVIAGLAILVIGPSA